MAGKNQVTLTFAGDSSSLERSFDRVGSSAKDMGDSVENAGRGFDRVGEGADTADTRAMGFRDTITGLQDLNKGLTGDFDSLGDQLFMIGMGFGDLASGVANFGVQFAQQIGTFIMNTGRAVASHVASTATMIAGWVAQGAAALVSGAQMAAAWLIGLGPIGLVIAAIAAIVAVLVALGVDFDDVKNAIGAGWEFIKNAAMGVFNWLKANWPLVLAIITGPIGLAVLAIVRNWDTIKRGFTAVKDWIGDRISDIVGFITGLPGRISSAASGMFDGIKSAFRSAINGIIGLWNNLSFPSITVGGQDPLGSFGPSLPRVTIGGWDLPNIPYLHTGGEFRAPTGQREGLAMLLNGERVLRPGDSGGVTVIVNAPLISSETELMRMVEDHFRRGGFGGLGL